jgi:hypothetical protein
MTELPGIPVTFDGGNPAIMRNIFFGEVLLEREAGERIVLQESRLDKDWRSVE